MEIFQRYRTFLEENEKEEKFVQKRENCIQDNGQDEGKWG